MVVHCLGSSGSGGSVDIELVFDSSQYKIELHIGLIVFDMVQLGSCICFGVEVYVLSLRSIEHWLVLFG